MGRSFPTLPQLPLTGTPAGATVLHMSTVAERARAAVQQAILSGRLERQPCEVCGAKTVDAHHDDYTQPLEVRWLCRRHHRQLHGTGRTASLVIRAAITRDEWNDIRKAAIDADRNVSDFVADLIRQAMRKENGK